MKKLIIGGMAMAGAVMANAAELTAKETAIADIGAWTARGEQDKLGAAFKAGFDAGLTLNEAKELVGQLYAYCGFPRALNAAGTLMKVAGEAKPTEGPAANMPRGSVDDAAYAAATKWCFLTAQSAKDQNISALSPLLVHPLRGQPSVGGYASPRLRVR